MILSSPRVHRAILRRGDHCELVYRTTPEVAPRGLVVAPETVSICGTDLQILRGQRADPASIVGHEGLSRVVQVGAEVHGFAIGDRVMVNPTHPTDPAFLLGHNVDGLLQARVQLPESALDGGLVVHAPPSLSSAMGTLIEPVSVVRYALNCLKLEKPSGLLILGDGLIGNLTAILAPLILGPDVGVGMLHRTELGLRWTRTHKPWVQSDRSIVGASSRLGDRVAVLSATHRAGTAPSLSACARVLGSRLVGVHLIGGVPAEAQTDAFPCVHLAAVRTWNTGGPWPPIRVTSLSSAGSVVFTGNRGTSTSDLHSAALFLESTDAVTSLAHLITHERDMQDGLDVLNVMTRTGDRRVNGELVLRLVITIDR